MAGVAIIWAVAVSAVLEAEAVSADLAVAASVAAVPQEGGDL